MEQNNQQQTAKIFTTRNQATTPLTWQTPQSATNDTFWRWGSDNQLPYALALMARRSTTHRRIINDKADYISGKGFTIDEGQLRTRELINCANPQGETLRQIMNKIALDKALFGNAFVEVVTDPERSYLALFHQDASRCRVARDNQHILLHHNWAQFTKADAQSLPLFPNFEIGADGQMHSIIHYKDYEPMYEHYGVPPYIAGMDVSTIAYKTDKWNISRIDNSFQLSGVMLLDGGVDNEEQVDNIVRAAQTKFAGKPGQVMFMIKDCNDGDSSRFIPITSSNEGDWSTLHDQATNDIIIAHSWFRSLSGLDYSSGFSSERILHEYEVALNTVILGEQSELLEPIRRVIELILGEETSTLEIVNTPPSRSKPLYMRIWEARKADGLDYDAEDPDQKRYVSEVTTYGLKHID